MRVIDMINAEMAAGTLPGSEGLAVGVTDANRLDSPGRLLGADGQRLANEPGPDAAVEERDTDQGVTGSEWGVAVVRIVALEPIAEADAIEVARFTFDDGPTAFTSEYPVVVRKSSFAPGDKAVYVPLDTVLPDAPEFSFLGSDKRRIRAKRLRGVYSEGLLVNWSDFASIVGRSVPDSFGDDAKEIADKTGEALAEILPVGADVSQFIGAKRYVESYGRPVSGGLLPRGRSAPDESVFPHYSVSNARKGEGIQYLAGDSRVIVTEKLHGANIRFGWVSSDSGAAGHNGRADADVADATKHDNAWVFRLGSHRTMRQWPTEGTYDWFQTCAAANLLISSTESQPGIVFYGEVLGVQDLTYGSPSAQGLRVFDAYNSNSGRWMHWSDVVEAARAAGLTTVPVLYDGRLDECHYGELAEGQTCLDGAAHVREGVVIRTFAGGGASRRWKFVGQGYKLRKNQKDLVIE